MCGDEVVGGVGVVGYGWGRRVVEGWRRGGVFRVVWWDGRWLWWGWGWVRSGERCGGWGGGGGGGGVIESPLSAYMLLTVKVVSTTVVLEANRQELFFSDGTASSAQLRMGL
eukprot:TRINITY_DN10939_c0_g1_i1.p1 TRINITY_DN10939_c0_g1~~TRINITY_DN10939_c0_g1_i1.p1  ORF type:complete len:112 (+),score=9.73 TRINITY_DN10939_c0_g1_i1:33-368(+)